MIGHAKTLSEMSLERFSLQCFESIVTSHENPELKPFVRTSKRINESRREVVDAKFKSNDGEILYARVFFLWTNCEMQRIT